MASKSIRIYVSHDAEKCWLPDDPAFEAVPATRVAGADAHAWGELAVLRHAWRSMSDVDADALGLAADGTFLASNFSFDRRRRVADPEYLSHRLDTRAIVLPGESNWILETNRAHYLRGHRELGLDALRDVVREVEPDYAHALDVRLGITHGHSTNVCLMRRDRMDEYCSWMFPLMEEVETSLLALGPDKVERHELADLAPFLLDAWLDRRGLTPVEVGLVRVDGRAHAPGIADELERDYRARYAPKSDGAE